MEENKLDKVIKEKFENRILTPSISSWERMENMLDASEKKSNRKWFFFVGIAASIILIFSVFLKMNSNQMDEIETPVVNDKIIVVAPEKEIISEEKKLEKDVPFVNENKYQEVASVVTEKEIVKSEKTKKNDSGFKKEIKTVDITKIVSEEEKLIAETSFENKLKVENNSKVAVKPQIRNKRIQVNSKDLLYAVTHSPNEVKEYYANLKLNRNDVLDSIKIQLKKSNLAINPEVILAEVERSIEDDEYQGNFKQNLGIKISNIIVAVANRNK